MQSYQFVPEVKERQLGEPCFVSLNIQQRGVGRNQVIFDLPNGTSIKQAEELAQMLRNSGATIRIG